MADVTYRKVLLATDGSDDASLAADHAIAVARAFHAALAVVSVVDIYISQDPLMAAVVVELIDRERDFLRQSVDALAARARQAGIADVDVRVLEGSPTNMLVEAIVETRADLVVVGSHGRNAIQRLLIGSTSEHLIRHAPCPVLVIRPSPPRQK
ncbi:MAG TPA: universal stress protein [Chloroflexota bacterium]|nr:universal stress protein [Chloroflexota bacterium]